MPGSSNTSFIPKKSGVQHARQTAVRQVYVGTLLVRILFAASLLAVAVVYGYQYKLKNDLDAQIVALNTAIADFNDSEMQRVISIDKRLQQVSNIMGRTLSVSSLLKAIEDSTVESVQINQLTVKREANNVGIVAELKTPSFDSALFQKTILEKSELLSVSKIADLQIDSVEIETPENSQPQDNEKKVAFKADLTIDIKKIPHTINTYVPETQFTNDQVSAPVENPDVAVDGAVLGDSIQNNQEEI